MFKCLLVIICVGITTIGCIPGYKNREKQTFWRDEPSNQSKTAERSRRQIIDIELIKGVEIAGLQGKETLDLSSLYNDSQDAKLLKTEIKSLLTALDVKEHKYYNSDRKSVEGITHTPKNSNNNKDENSSYNYDINEQTYVDHRHYSPSPTPQRDDDREQTSPQWDDSVVPPTPVPHVWPSPFIRDPDKNKPTPFRNEHKEPPPPPRDENREFPPPTQDKDREPPWADDVGPPTPPPHYWLPPPPPPRDYDKRPPRNNDERPPPPPPYDDYDRRPPPYDDYGRRPPPPPRDDDREPPPPHHGPPPHYDDGRPPPPPPHHHGHPPPPPPPPPHHHGHPPPPPPPPPYHHGYPPPPPHNDYRSNYYDRSSYDYYKPPPKPDDDRQSRQSSYYDSPRHYNDRPPSPHPGGYPPRPYHGGPPHYEDPHQRPYHERPPTYGHLQHYYRDPHSPPSHGGPPPHHGGPPPHHGGPPPYHSSPPPQHGGPPPHHGGLPTHHGSPPPYHERGPPPPDRKQEQYENQSPHQPYSDRSPLYERESRNNSPFSEPNNREEQEKFAKLTNFVHNASTNKPPRNVDEQSVLDVRFADDLSVRTSNSPVTTGAEETTPLIPFIFQAAAVTPED